MIKICSICKIEFEAKRRTQAYCKVCLKAYNRRRNRCNYANEVADYILKDTLKNTPDEETKKALSRKYGLPTKKERKSDNGILRVNPDFMDKIKDKYNKQ